MEPIKDLSKPDNGNMDRADITPARTSARTGPALPVTPLRGRSMEIMERINSKADKSQSPPGSRLPSFNHSAFQSIGPPDPHSQYNYVHSPQVATATTPRGLWNSYEHHTRSYTDFEFDVLNSPSLPKNFVFSAALAQNTGRNTAPFRGSGQYDPFVSPKARGFSHVVDRREDRFGESDDPDDSYDSDTSEDSDATITPSSYAISVASHTRSYQRQHCTLFNELGGSTFTNKSSNTKTLVLSTTEEMAPNHVAKNGTTEPHAIIAGPHLGTIKVGHQYICECHIRRMFVEKRLDAAREANYRLQGVQVIESTREALLLPVKTYNAACTFYHRFRLEHPTHDYNYTDAALASLFVACKVEDTLKKSREVLCAHHNLKNSDHPTTQDDKIFDQPSKVIIGIERYMVEAINFDFRVRYPQKILAKIVKKVLGKSADLTSFFPTAMKMSIDLYKTYAPLKHSSYTCALVVAQLTAMITGRFVDDFQTLDPLDWHTDEQCVAEVMLDLLDLYTQHGKVTKVGPIFDLQVFIDTQISINQFVERAGLLRYLNQCRECESIVLPPTPSTGSPMSLSTPSAAGTSTVKRGPKGPDGGTTRFVFDADEAVREKKVYDEHTKDEWEEWEEEIEEPIPDSREDRRHEPRGPRGPRGHGHGPGHGRGHGRGGFDPGWTPRNRHDRRRRGGGFY